MSESTQYIVMALILFAVMTPNILSLVRNRNNKDKRWAALRWFQIIVTAFSTVTALWFVWLACKG